MAILDFMYDWYKQITFVILMIVVVLLGVFVFGVDLGFNAETGTMLGVSAIVLVPTMTKI